MEKKKKKKKGKEVDFSATQQVNCPETLKDRLFYFCSFSAEEEVSVLDGVSVDDWAAAICQAGIPGRDPPVLKVAAIREGNPSIGEEGVVGVLDPCSGTLGRRLIRRDLSDFISFWSSVKTAFCASLLRSNAYIVVRFILFQHSGCDYLWH